MSEQTILRAQAGKQSDFLANPADIVIYGGAAGGGKTYGVLLDALRHLAKLKNINMAAFRREATDLKKPGAIWDESKKIYPFAGGRPNNQELSWTFNKSSRIKFSGLQHENDMYAWQGAQLDVLYFDELTHFTELQFWYLIGRLRSVSGQIKPYARATCNPENNWVFSLISWWIDEKGYPILDRSGKLRWFYRYSDKMYWFDSEKAANRDLASKDLKNIKPLSFTFIPANINDNPILLKNNPNYYAMLAQLPEHEKIKLLDGNWLFRPAGKLFKADDFKLFAINPREPDLRMITIDTASETKTANDYTVMQVWSRSNGIYLEKQIRGKYDFGAQLQLLESLIYEVKPHYVSIEKASSGFGLITEIRKRTAVPILAISRSKDKYSRGYEAQGYVKGGYVYVNPQADYYTDFISECAQFSPENKNKSGVHDDQVDPMLDAVYYLLIQKIGQNRHKTPEILTNYAKKPTQRSSVF